MIDVHDARDITRDVFEYKYGEFLTKKIKDAARSGFSSVIVLKSKLEGCRDLLNLKYFVDEFTDFEASDVDNVNDSYPPEGAMSDDKYITISW